MKDEVLRKVRAMKPKEMKRKKAKVEEENRQQWDEMAKSVLVRKPCPICVQWIYLYARGSIIQEIISFLCYKKD